MTTNRYWLFLLGLCLAFLWTFLPASCVVPAEKQELMESNRVKGRTESVRSTDMSVPEFGGGPGGFKIPVPPGFDWEVTQSWAQHCEMCNAKGYDWDYCSDAMSHTWDCCRYGWDFNLSGYSDHGKPVLASAGGVVRDINDNTGWGITLVIDHGDGVCTRYAHMVDGSTDHLTVGQSVCQGLQIGEIGDTGTSAGSHLHFQFENCETRESLEKGFTDGNGVPVCTRGNDVYDASGRYSFLKLTNEVRHDCGGSSEQVFGGASLPTEGWKSASCGTLSGCPLIPNCGRSSGHQFADYYNLGDRTAQAASYLWSECSLDGKADGKLHPLDSITRAEALKIPMYLFGLMEDCGFDVPFEDVHPGDWFYTVVACAVRQGVISNMSTAFNPNQKVTFAEAAKFLVQAAVKAGVISMQNPASGHFPAIDNSHWAYGYVETLHAYGGTVPQSLNHDADAQVERREYVIMAASLSPCFCSNVACDGSCTCDQSTFSCVDPRDRSPGIGGDDSPESSPRDDDEDENAPDPDDDSPADLPDLVIDCSIDLKWCRCAGDETILFIRCDLRNDGEEDVHVNDLVMSLAEPMDPCEITHEHLRSGVGTQGLDPGESKRMTGHFEISCVQQPETAEVDAVFDAVLKDGRTTMRYEDLLETSIEIIDEPFTACREDRRTPAENMPEDYASPPEEVPPAEATPPDNQPQRRDQPEPPPAFNCDPAQGYKLWMWSPGGDSDILATGLDRPVHLDFLPGMNMFVRFDCNELPGAVLIHGGAEGLHVWRDNDSLPSFSVWVPYQGPLTIDPPHNPDVIVPSFATDLANLDILIRIPPD